MIRPTVSGVHARQIKEVFRPGDPGYWVHPEWEADFPWIAQGTTSKRREKGGRARNFARFTDPPAKGVRHAWEALGARLGFPRIAHSRQVHGRNVTVYEWTPSTGAWLEQQQAHENQAQDDSCSGDHSTQKGRMILGPDADGHLTASEGVLLAVTVADCVPVFLVDPVTRVAGLLHAGWRGTTVGILERGIALLREEFGGLPGDLHLHLGPAICGECYEVGVEVHHALGFPDPGEPTPVDLRASLASRAVELGVAEARVTQSGWCTLCEGSPFFSHRRGDLARQVGFLGIRMEEGEDPAGN